MKYDSLTELCLCNIPHSLLRLEKKSKDFNYTKKNPNPVIPGIKEENKILSTNSHSPSLFFLHMILMHICCSLAFTFT